MTIQFNGKEIKSIVPAPFTIQGYNVVRLNADRETFQTIAWVNDPHPPSEQLMVAWGAIGSVLGNIWRELKPGAFGDDRDLELQELVYKTKNRSTYYSADDIIRICELLRELEEISANEIQ